MKSFRFDAASPYQSWIDQHELSTARTLITAIGKKGEKSGEKRKKCAPCNPSRTLKSSRQKILNYKYIAQLVLRLCGSWWEPNEILMNNCLLLFTIHVALSLDSPVRVDESVPRCHCTATMQVDKIKEKYNTCFMHYTYCTVYSICIQCVSVNMRTSHTPLEILSKYFAVDMVVCVCLFPLVFLLLLFLSTLFHSVFAPLPYAWHATVVTYLYTTHVFPYCSVLPDTAQGQTLLD